MSFIGYLIELVIEEVMLIKDARITDVGRQAGKVGSYAMRMEVGSPTY